MRRSGSRSRRPITARSGWWASGSSYSSRTVSSGSSASTVPVPTSITSHCARNRWASTRAAWEVTQRLLPSAAALRPSSVAANFQVTNGRWCSMPKVQARFSARASRSIRPNATSTPASRNVVSPPAAIGLGSGCANTTRATPASTMARAQGPVRPVWLHGSSVTTAVAPRASAPASARAAASACGLPAPRWYPSAISAPSASSRTHPTRGFGPSGTPGVRASSSARRIARCSLPLNSISPLRIVRSRTPGRGRVDRVRRPRDSCVLLLIRTLTVGPGVPPGQPDAFHLAVECGRVADF